MLNLRSISKEPSLTSRAPGNDSIGLGMRFSVGSLIGNLGSPLEVADEEEGNDVDGVEYLQTSSAPRPTHGDEESQIDP